MSTATLVKTVLVDDYFLLCELYGNTFEFVGGKVVWRFDHTVIPDELVFRLLEERIPISQLSLSLIMPTPKHNTIIANLHKKLVKQLDDEHFSVHSNAPQVHIPRTESFRVPDVTVVKMPESYNEKHELQNPTLIIEVLSPSTQNVDKQEKLAEYQSIESLQEYVLVSQNQTLIEQYTRQSKKIWQYKVNDSEDTHLDLPSLQAAVEMEAIYKKVFEKKGK